MRKAILGLALAVLFSVPKITYADDAENGLRLARRWCSSYHLVSDEQVRANDATPAFRSIAQRKNLNAEKLAFFLLNPHPIMPNMSLTRAEAQDIVAYIAKLRMPPRRP